jgi:uroporphyrin-III C-methyltransferase/precorrin-2 dehydrogenase/sirohydrochlorin ferrochelatase/uroporphyrin-III C-methyltransferase
MSLSPKKIAGKQESSINAACVYLVGAGPGDPELLTVKALRLINSADVIVYDRLVSDAIIEQLPRGVAKVYVGKSTGRHSLPQDEINALLVKLAKEHRSIVRLKGGDPFIFGRGSEEADVLVQNNIKFEVIPGITSAMACATYAGIPLTHRGLADSLHIITGHRQNNLGLDLDQGAFSDQNCTLAIYMGLGNLAPIVHCVIQAGRPANTPVAVIEQGTTSRQRRVLSTLENLVEDTQAAAITPPAMVVIGNVVSLATRLEWFEGGGQDEQEHPALQRSVS